MREGEREEVREGGGLDGRDIVQSLQARTNTITCSINTQLIILLCY